MLTVSDAYKEANAQSNPVSILEVNYKRRYWDDATKSYIWESSWTSIPRDDVVSISPINAKLDTEKINEFKVSNVTVTLKNTDNRWREDNPSGNFGKDSTSPLHGYISYWTKFQIKYGYTLADGTDETVSIFVGVSDKFQYDTMDDKAQVTVQGLEALLTASDAENVSTTVTNETIGTGDGSTTDFTTANPGVGIIDEVSIDGIEQEAGVDYTVSDLDDETAGATISFTTAPAGGEVLRCSYRYWQQNSLVSDLVSDLLVEAGILSGSQDLDPVLFEGKVDVKFSQDTKAEWDSGTLTRLDSDIEPGSLRLDTSDANALSLRDDFDGGLDAAWNEVSATVSGVSNKMRISADTDTGGGTYSGRATIVMTQWGKLGSWEIKFQLASTNTTGLGTVLKFNMGLYEVKFFLNSLGGRVDILGPFGSSYNGAWVPDTSQHTLKFTVDGRGNSRVLMDGSVLAQGTLSLDTNVFTTQSIFGVGLSVAPSGFTVDLDDFKEPAGEITGTHVAQIDAGSPLIWGRIFPVDKEIFSALGSNTGAKIEIDTRSSTDGMAWDSWLAISSNGQVNSAVKRFIEIRSTLTGKLFHGDDPVLRSYLFEYVSNSTPVSLARFTGLNVYNAIKNLAKFANYEFGFNPAETFFFRSRRSATSDVDLELDESSVIKVISMDNGYDRLYSEVEAKYGSFKRVITDPGDYAGAPKGIVSRRRLTVEDAGIFTNPDADIASGVAQTYAKEFMQIRRRVKIQTKIFPWVELGDTVRLSFQNNSPEKVWFWGDAGVNWGDTDAHYFGGKDQIVHKFLSKVVGAKHDTKNEISELELEELNL